MEEGAKSGWMERTVGSSCVGDGMLVFRYETLTPMYISLE